MEGLGLAEVRAIYEVIPSPVCSVILVKDSDILPKEELHRSFCEGAYK